jgi:hypothetical protein
MFVELIERFKRCISYLKDHDLPSVNDIEKRNLIADKINQHLWQNTGLASFPGPGTFRFKADH